MEKQKKIALINDISCVGRCSLTAAIPIISACGFESVPLPTGIFSAHTEFDGFVCTDLTDKMQSFADHWKNIGIRFDAIYTGYLATKEQAETVKRFLIDFKKSDTLCIVDPVMGDNGTFYNRIDESFVGEMHFLCSMADIITPNVTEAEMIAGIDCTKPPYSADHIKDLLIKLRNLGTPKIVITGIENEDGQIGCAVYDSYTRKANMFFTPKAEGRFPGAGDVFAASLASAVMSGKEFTEAVQIAMSFTCDCVEKTALTDEPRRFGLQFEPQIYKLIKAVK
ncbi:MAG: pyridoxamine kinase [Clostridia bacterium]|nr:pyridoxamine kinase [Clostridia bacterium]